MNTIFLLVGIVLLSLAVAIVYAAWAGRLEREDNNTPINIHNESKE